jgi:SAM-dependent methyltransferase
MPYSSDVFDEFLKAQLALWNYKRYLDVGCGAGKYGRMIRDLVPDSHITGIEVDNEYIEAFRLRRTYDEVINASVESVLGGPQAVTYDVVVFGDVIEHLRKSDGIDALHFFVYRCKRMIVVYPSKYIQYDINGKAHESHRSVWTPQDFLPFAGDLTTNGHMNLAIIQGYLDDNDAVYPTGKPW